MSHTMYNITHAVPWHHTTDDPCGGQHGHPGQRNAALQDTAQGAARGSNARGPRWEQREHRGRRGPRQQARHDVEHQGTDSPSVCCPPIK